MEQRYDSSSTVDNSTTGNLFKVPHPSPGSSHGMMSSSGSNMGIPIQQMNHNGHHSALGMHDHLPSLKSNNLWVPNNNNSMMNNHGMMAAANTNNSVHNINAMPGGHNNNLDMADSYN
jgi:hypothetical protein